MIIVIRCRETSYDYLIIGCLSIVLAHEKFPKFHTANVRLFNYFVTINKKLDVLISYSFLFSLKELDVNLLREVYLLEI